MDLTIAEPTYLPFAFFRNVNVVKIDSKVDSFDILMQELNGVQERKKI